MEKKKLISRYKSRIIFCKGKGTEKCVSRIESPFSSSLEISQMFPSLHKGCIAAYINANGTRSRQDYMRNKSNKSLARNSFDFLNMFDMRTGDTHAVVSR